MTDNKWKNIVLETIGCFVSAMGMYTFAVAAGVPITGIAGIGTIVYRLFGVPIGIFNILLNIPIVLVCYRLLGRDFFLRSVRCMILFAVFSDFVLPLLPMYTGDRMLATICGGVISGIGDALIYMQNSSTGGMDFITMAVKVKHPHMPFGNITFFAALFVILLNGVVFRDVDSIIFGLILNFLSSYIINRLMFGFNACMMAMIVTSDGTAVCNEIDRTIDRGSTILKGYGGFRQDEREVVLCACSSKQLYTIEKAIKKIDPGCFIVMLQANEVQGEGFRRLELGKNEENK